MISNLKNIKALGISIYLNNAYIALFYMSYIKTNSSLEAHILCLYLCSGFASFASIKRSHLIEILQI
jgi:hypothetical protein